MALTRALCASRSVLRGASGNAACQKRCQKPRRARSRDRNAEGLADASPCLRSKWSLVGRAGVEPATNGLKAAVCESATYEDARCVFCSTMQDCAQPTHAKFTHEHGSAEIAQSFGRVRERNFGSRGTPGGRSLAATSDLEIRGASARGCVGGPAMPRRASGAGFADTRAGGRTPPGEDQMSPSLPSRPSRWTSARRSARVFWADCRSNCSAELSSVGVMEPIGFRHKGARRFSA